MEIKQVKRMNLTKEQAAVVKGLMRELWDIEEPFLQHVPAMYGGLEYMLISAFNKLDDLLLGYVDGELVAFLGNQIECHNEVDKLVVKQEHRGKGYGRCLIHGFKLIVRKPMFVIITPGNVNACKFYETVGFDVEDKENRVGAHIDRYQVGYFTGALDRCLNYEIGVLDGSS